MKRQIKSVSIRRAEGEGHAMGDIWHTFPTMHLANVTMLFFEGSYPELGYHKHDYKIVWDDDCEYSGRIDCMHPTNKFYKDGCNRIDSNVREQLSWIINEGAQFNYVSKIDIQNAKMILDNYEL